MLYAVIMAGGKGARFWPQSRERRPKQFLSMGGTVSMLRQTVNRLLPIIPPERIYVIGNKKYQQLTINELPNIPRQNIIAEPVGRNTAACLALACYRVQDPEAVFIAVPADHLIQNTTMFVSLAKAASQLASVQQIFVTFGIPPTCPHTGYGYVERSNKHVSCGKVSFYTVKKFIEKPAYKKACFFVKTKRFYWNSGIFVFSRETYVEALKTCLPEVYDVFQKEIKAFGSAREKTALTRIYSRIPSWSIDYGIMEKISNVCIVPAPMGWNDVGSWKALESVLPVDGQSNNIAATVAMIESSNNIVVGDKRKIIGLVGVNDIVVVDTPDALLIVHKHVCEKVKDLVSSLERKRMKKYL